MSDGFAEFYEAHYQHIAAQLYAYLGDESEAQDLAQEAFVRALDQWERISAYDHPQAWVRQVAWNLATSRLRHLQVVVRHLISQRPERVEGPNPDRIVLVNALAALPADHRLAVVLHHIGDLSTSEIAQQRGVAEGTVRSWLSRGRSRLAEDLAEWRPRFVPPGVDAAKATVRSRRIRRRSTLAALVVLAIGLAAVAVRVGGGGETEIIAPTPDPTSSPRHMSLPGVDIPGPPNTQFVDGRHAWTLMQSCVDGAKPRCRSALGVTEDTAATWRKVTLPAQSGEGHLDLRAVDARTAILTLLPSPGVVAGAWVTRDGGATFKWYPSESELVPEMAALVLPKFDLRCREQKPDDECDRWNLVEPAIGKVVSVLPFTGSRPILMVGADGRLWLHEAATPPAWLAVSDNHGNGWRDLAWPERAEKLHFTPDGRGVWAITESTESNVDRTIFWELDGAQWRQRMSIIEGGLDNFSPVLLDGGIWLVMRRQTLSYLKDGRFTEIPGIARPRGVSVLSDDSLLIGSGTETFVGLGTGMDRDWIRVAPY